jgi:hypothetical protein
MMKNDLKTQAQDHKNNKDKEQSMIINGCLVKVEKKKRNSKFGLLSKRSTTAGVVVCCWSINFCDVIRNASTKKRHQTSDKHVHGE